MAPNRTKAFDAFTSLASEDFDKYRDYHESLLDESTESSYGRGVRTEEIRTAPLFTAQVQKRLTTSASKKQKSLIEEIMPQYGLLAKVLEAFGNDGGENAANLLGFQPQVNGVSEWAQEEQADDRRLFLNMNAPWSAFICGSQGSGKSHTLSCMLEAGLLKSKLGPLPQPLAAMVFHYDKFTGFQSTQVCEAAYLASSGIPVKVMVSPTSYHRMREVYANLPGFPHDVPKPQVVPLFLMEQHLNVERMMKLMAVDDDGKTALYMETVCRILRSLALRNPGTIGLDYKEFKRRIELETLNPAQSAMINMRLGLLESFIYEPDIKGGTSAKTPFFEETKKGKDAARKWEEAEDSKRRAALGKATIWSFEPGTLTIVDLSCPFVDESAACAMFNIVMALFLEERGKAGRMVALDEAHKYMTGSNSGNAFTESLLSVIRQQRHLATRVIIATQEPTISPSLLDLSSMTIVHRFTSPAWLKSLEAHLGGIYKEGKTSQKDVATIFKRIVELDAGQALLFSPSAMLKVAGTPSENKSKVDKLGTAYVKIRVRKRLTADGGRSIMAA
ncbi:MAG: hypothetical protein Q9163_002937 [Psora crenata]